MGCCDLKCGLIAGAVVGALMAVLGGILIPVGDCIIKGTVNKEAVLENGTTAYENWVSAGAPVYRQFWLFDVQNPLEVVQNGSKPVVVEKGPYTYKTRYIPKENITFYDNHTVTFQLPNGAIFDPSMSVGPEEDTVTALNLGVVGAYSEIPKILHGLLQDMINSSGASLFQNRTVKEMLWGYQDPMLTTTLGVFYPYNDTYDGPYNVFTGKDDISKVSLIDLWERNRHVSYWKNTYCNMINGTDASSFPPFLDKKKPLYFFSSDICRSVAAEYSGTLDLKGIEVYRYMLPASTLASPTVNPDNMCYCTDPVVTKNCTMAGVLDVSGCTGKPAFISLPHFLHGSTYLVEAVQGLRPSEEEHPTFLDVEPITGFTLRFAKRLQLNMMYGPSDIVRILSKVKDYTIFPVLWLNETAALDDPTADMLKAELISRIQTLETVQTAMMALGSVLFAICLIAISILKSRQARRIV